MNHFFNAFHSPIGAHASFTLGCLGRTGGLGLELGQPADQNIYVGVETRKGGAFEALPFFEGGENEAARYDHAVAEAQAAQVVCPFPLDAVTRDFNLSSDTWEAGDLVFKIFSPVEAAPDPEKTSRADQKRAYCPAVTAELTIDNRKGTVSRRAFFGFQDGGGCDSLHWVRQPGLSGIAKGQSYGIFTDDPGAVTAQAFTADVILSETEPLNYQDGLGQTGLILFDVPAGKRKTFRFALCFFRGGQVTTGLPTSYWYTRFFADLEAVGAYALKHFAEGRKRSRTADRLLASRKLSDDQRFHMAHAIRSYYGSTQLLDNQGKPLWVVNEGEYRMMNTFDLTVDQVFYELRMNPWTVRNELDLFCGRYSYTDRLHFPGDANDYSGGLSFTHDMGCRNHFSRPGYSSYERFAQDGCFSHMTHEQLVNWVLCASLYAHHTQDKRWIKKKLPVFRQCLRSMMRRDHPKASQRNGVMGLDSSRTLGGSEITTYDSLDVSLGQARNNVYIAVKGWAAYVALERLLRSQGLGKEASASAQQASRAAATIAGALTDEGYIPAIMGEDCHSKIIPAIEGLVFPYTLDQAEALQEDGPYGGLISALRTHFENVLTRDVCLYPDGGWKLSSSADNSWLSKIYLCQFVARKILGIRTPETGRTADAAHRAWLLKDENLYFAWSDQMRSGVAHGSKYYPRGVTSILWLDE